MKISQIFAAENFSEPNKIDWVKQEAGYLLKIMENDPNFILMDPPDMALSPALLVRFFRHRERSEKVRYILQYLLSFLSHVPTNSEVREEPVNPAKQFRDFIRYEADLLLEEDVKNAVFHESNLKNQDRAGSVWDFQERIIVTNRRLTNMLAKEEDNVAWSISIQCRVLEQLSIFWFDVRSQDLRRTRRSDIFMYLLSQLVRMRCWQIVTP